VHGHRHHGGGQVLQVASQRLAQGVHVEGLQVAQAPICQGRDFPRVTGTAPGTQLAAPALPEPVLEATAPDPASHHGTRQPGATGELGQPSGTRRRVPGSVPCVPERRWLWKPRQVPAGKGERSRWVLKPPALSPATGILGSHDSGESFVPCCW